MYVHLQVDPSHFEFQRAGTTSEVEFEMPAQLNSKRR